MALITCAECGKEFSDKALACPNCGCPIQDQKIYDDPDIKVINGKEVNLFSIVKIYGKNKLGATSALVSQCKISYTDAKQIMYEYYTEIGDRADIKFGDRLKNDFKRANDINAVKNEQKRDDKNREKERLKELNKTHTVYCKKCKSTNIEYVEKKLSIGRALVGNELAGPTGAILGGLSSKKGYAKCLNCGYKWKI